MTHRAALQLIGINLAALAALSFIYPQLMIAPGPLIDAHHKLASDCFACHAAFRGSSPQKCMRCHKPDEIGRLTTAGQPILGRKISVPFHQGLVERDCIACHSDHAGQLKYRSVRRFSHSLLDATVRERCEECHRKPDDSLHAKIAGNCLQCHERERWKPANFAHDEKFALDRDHDVKCATCHVGKDFRSYTCYGCHEHTPADMRARHWEEGVSDAELDRCAECHRAAEGD